MAEPDSQHKFETYDVEAAIQEAAKCSEQLRTQTNTATHRFKPEWLDQLVERYRKYPGRQIVHLSNLGGSVVPVLSKRASSIVSPYYDRLAHEKGTRFARTHFQSITAFVEKEGGCVTKLATWNRFSELTGFKIDSLEPFVCSLKTSGGNGMRVIEHPNLPMNLDTPAGAKLIGYRLDSNYKNSAFTNKNARLHEDYRMAAIGVIGEIPITETRITTSGFTSDTYLRTNVGSLVSNVLSIAGLENTQEQRTANCPIPLWLFLSPLKVVVSLIAAAWDAEGSVSKQDLKLRQSVHLDGLDYESVPMWPGSLPFGALNQKAKENFLSNPPKVLTSIALLLQRIRVNSRVVPDRVSNTSKGLSAYWHLRVMTNNSVRSFHEHVRLLSESKQSGLDKNVETMRWRWASRN